MNITEIRIHKTENTESNVKAVASVTIDGAFVIHDIKVIQTKNGKLFAAMPSRRYKDNKTGKDEFMDIAHPIQKSVRQEFDQKILEAYDKLA